MFCFHYLIFPSAGEFIFKAKPVSETGELIDNPLF